MVPVCSTLPRFDFFFFFFFFLTFGDFFIVTLIIIFYFYKLRVCFNCGQVVLLVLNSAYFFGCLKFTMYYYKF